MHSCRAVCTWDSEGNLLDSVVSFHNVDLRDWFQAVSLGAQAPLPAQPLPTQKHLYTYMPLPSAFRAAQELEACGSRWGLPSNSDIFLWLRNHLVNVDCLLLDVQYLKYLLS